MLSNTLRNTVKSFTDVFISLDASDECKESDDLATNIGEMAGWDIVRLHTLVTSWQEKDIEELLSTVLDDKYKVCIERALVERDIRVNVQSRIRTDRKLKKWQVPEVQAEIEMVLMEKVGDM